MPKPSPFITCEEGRPIAVADDSCYDLLEVVAELAQRRSLVSVVQARPELELSAESVKLLAYATVDALAMSDVVAKAAEATKR